MKQILQKTVIGGLVCLLAAFSITQAQTIPGGGFEEVGPGGSPSSVTGPYTDPAGNFVVATPTLNPGTIYFSIGNFDYYLDRDQNCVADQPEPHSGSRSRGFTYDEVIAMKLSAPLTVGGCYTVNFFVNNPDGESSCFQDASIEFGSSSYTADLTNPTVVFGSGISPSISVTNTQTSAWQPKSFTFTVTTADTYITFRIPPSALSSNVLHIDDLSIKNTCSAMPVKFINFDAKPTGKTAQLMWSTSMEYNSRGFEIQRSTDARKWQVMGFVNSREGSVDSRKTYSWSDEIPLEGINYYRLKQVDLDGTVDFSKVVTATFASENKLTVAPNPVTDRLKLRNGTVSSIVGVKLINTTGHTVYQSSVFTDEGIDMRNLPAGVYILHLQQSNGKVQIQKVIKQ